MSVKRIVEYRVLSIAYRKKAAYLSLLFFILGSLLSTAYATPCYGTKMPKKNKFFMGLQDYTLLKRYQEEFLGTMRSVQNFLLLSYGVVDWFAIDFKGGAGDIRQHPTGETEIDYEFNFAGGYGFRMRLIEKKKFKWVWGFQHISVHPHSARVGFIRHRAILDDWQVSTLASYDFGLVAPYIGTRWSRVDYIHRIEDIRKRVMSDAHKSYGLIVGFDVPVSEKVWVNLEGQFFDSDAFAVSINYSF